MTKKLNILIAGCGDVGTAAGLILARKHKVFGLKRSKGLLPAPIHTISADLNTLSTLRDLPDIDILIYCAAPNIRASSRLSLSAEDKNELYNQTYLHGFSNIITALNKAPLHVFFTSSTSVYHQKNHELINEQSDTFPETQTGKIMLAAEQQVSSLELPTSIIRFSGIYSSKRLSMFNRVTEGAIYANIPIKFSNRIHVDDCAGVINHLVNLVPSANLQPIYLASDNLPEETHTVSSWLSEQLNIQPNSIIQNSLTGSKRCDNSLLLSTGYQFSFPSYQEGYAQAIDNFVTKKLQ